MKKALLIAVAMVVLPSLGRGQGAPTITEKEGASNPAPRLPDGRPDLSGPWLGGGTNNDFEKDAGMARGELESVLQPWAKELMHSRKEKDEPYTACLPMGVPRVNPYPYRIVESYTAQGMSHIFILHETGDSGAHRQVFMDGRRHPDSNDLFPTWFGHSIGWWDGDTLVVDTVGYNDKFWFDALGTPHTEQLHTIERYTRTNEGTLINEFTLDDPGAFTRPLTFTFTAKRLRPGSELMEFICLEDNEYGLASGLTPADEGGQKEKAKGQAAPNK